MPPKRILILGPESTGKSTLAADLSMHFGEPWVPEYAREYLEKLDRDYRYEDLLKIAKGQMALEDNLATIASEYLFCDTDLRVIKIWSLHRFGKVDPWVTEEIENRYYFKLILTDVDLPWQPDPLREYPDLGMREYFLEKYIQLAKESGFPYRLVSGPRKERLRKSLEFINRQ